MSYSELERAVLKARAVDSKAETSLFEIVAAHSSGIDSEEFVDAVSRNLARGRAVIAVVGDGIREDIIPIVLILEFLERTRQRISSCGICSKSRLS
jgi:hypothetical protein